MLVIGKVDINMYLIEVTHGDGSLGGRKQRYVVAAPTEEVAKERIGYKNQRTLESSNLDYFCIYDEGQEVKSYRARIENGLRVRE